MAIVIGQRKQGEAVSPKRLFNSEFWAIVRGLKMKGWNIMLGRLRGFCNLKICKTKARAELWCPDMPRKTISALKAHVSTNVKIEKIRIRKF